MFLKAQLMVQFVDFGSHLDITSIQRELCGLESASLYNG
jgi:hypothetical protein